MKNGPKSSRVSSSPLIRLEVLLCTSVSGLSVWCICDRSVLPTRGSSLTNIAWTINQIELTTNRGLWIAWFGLMNLRSLLKSIQLGETCSPLGCIRGQIHWQASWGCWFLLGFLLVVQSVSRLHESNYGGWLFVLWGSDRDSWVLGVCGVHVLRVFQLRRKSVWAH